jgi:hypothetical protein
MLALIIHIYLDYLIEILHKYLYLLKFVHQNFDNYSNEYILNIEQIFVILMKHVKYELIYQEIKLDQYVHYEVYLIHLNHFLIKIFLVLIEYENQIYQNMNHQLYEINSMFYYE